MVPRSTSIGASIAALAAYLVVGSLPASATMAPYEIEKWKGDGPITLHAEERSQVFAGAFITPIGNGKFHYHLKCEHNAPGESNTVYTLEFLSAGKVVYSAAKLCRLGGSSTFSLGPIISAQWGADRPDFDYDLDLSKVIDTVDQIKFSQRGVAEDPLHPREHCTFMIGDSCVSAGPK